MGADEQLGGYARHRTRFRSVLQGIYAPFPPLCRAWCSSPSPNPNPHQHHPPPLPPPHTYTDRRDIWSDSYLLISVGLFFRFRGSSSTSAIGIQTQSARNQHFHSWSVWRHVVFTWSFHTRHVTRRVFSRNVVLYLVFTLACVLARKAGQVWLTR